MFLTPDEFRLLRDHIERERWKNLATWLVRDNTLQLNRQTLVVVDQAGMVGADDLRLLLTATTAASTKTILSATRTNSH